MLSENGNSIGVAIVCYNTPYIITTAVSSVQSYVSEVLIINSSDKENKAFSECNNLAEIYDNVSVCNTYDNIGHGKGLNLAIEKLKSEFIICMDSDAELLDHTLIDDMLNYIKDDSVYGCGRVLRFKTKYLYLPFCMIKKSTFNKYHPFVHSGAPFEKTMKDINGKKKLIDIPNFMSKLYHRGRATREIAGHWRKGFGGKDGV
jgi:GT2 family glycosyltransferase